MSLTRQDVETIARLARLEVGDEEADGLVAGLSDILEFVEQLGAADVADVEPMAHPLDTVQRLRADAVTESDQRQRYQADAPQTENGLYVVPPVID